MQKKIENREKPTKTPCLRKREKEREPKSKVFFREKTEKSGKRSRPKYLPLHFLRQMFFAILREKKLKCDIIPFFQGQKIIIKN